MYAGGSNHLAVPMLLIPRTRCSLRSRKRVLSIVSTFLFRSNGFSWYHRTVQRESKQVHKSGSGTNKQDMGDCEDQFRIKKRSVFFIPFVQRISSFYNNSPGEQTPLEPLAHQENCWIFAMIMLGFTADRRDHRVIGQRLRALLTCLPAIVCGYERDTAAAAPTGQVLSTT